MSDFKLPWLAIETNETDEVLAPEPAKTLRLETAETRHLKSGQIYQASELVLNSGSGIRKKLWDTEPLSTLELGMSVTWETMPLATAKTITVRLNKRHFPKRWRAVKHETGAVEIARIE